MLPNNPQKINVTHLHIALMHSPKIHGLLALGKYVLRVANNFCAQMLPATALLYMDSEKVHLCHINSKKWHLDNTDSEKVHHIKIMSKKVHCKQFDSEKIHGEIFV